MVYTSLEVCKKFAKENTFIFKGILNRGANISDDIISYFNDTNKSYLILIDDVNRVQTALDYIQNYYGEKLQNRTLKIVATVRDYAKEQALQKFSYLNLSEFKLKPLEDKSIEKIVKDEYQITNPSYLERIVDISQGNPRLAIMASSVAIEKNDLSALYNVSSLYDRYFLNIKEDLEILGDDNILLSIIIVAFFRAVDKKNQEQCELIQSTFSVSIRELWKHIEKLHYLEIFDLYENEIVKISDQILSTYLFYKIVFVDKKISIDVFLENLFLQYQSKFKDILNPILNTFDTSFVINTLKKPVNKLWSKYLNDEQNLYRVIDTFWYLKQTDILVYFNEKIQNMPNKDFDISSINFQDRRNTNAISDDILQKLLLFQYGDSQNIKSATELILLYFQKNPSIFLDVLQVLTDEYGFKHDSYLWKYKKGNTLLDTIWQNCNNGNNELICKLFIQICKEFLKVEFKDTKSKGMQFTIKHFKLVETDELKTIRDNIFKYLSNLYKNIKYQTDIIKLIEDSSSRMSFQHGVSKVEKWDSENIIKFIEDNFDYTIYKHAKVVNKCLDGFDNHKITYKKNIRDKFQHPIYQLEKIIMLDIYDASIGEDEKLDWKEREEIKKNKLAKFVKKL